MKIKYRNIIFSSIMATAIILPTLTLTSCSTVSIANRALSVKCNLMREPGEIDDLAFNSYVSYLPTEFRFWDDGKSGQHIYGDMITKSPGNDSTGKPYPWPTDAIKSWIEYNKISFSYKDDGAERYDYGLYNQYISTLICSSIGYQIASNISLLLNYERLHPEIWSFYDQTNYETYKEFNYALANTLSVGSSQVYFAVDSISFDLNMSIFSEGEPKKTSNILQSPGINSVFTEEINSSVWNTITPETAMSGGLIPYYNQNNDVYTVEKDPKTGCWAYKPYPVIISNIEISYSYYNPTIFNNSNPSEMDIKNLQIVKDAVANSGDAWIQIGETEPIAPSTLDWTVTTTPDDGDKVQSSDPRINGSFYPGDVIMMLQFADDPNTVVPDNPETTAIDESDHTPAKQVLTGAPSTSSEETANWFFLEFINYYDQAEIDSNKEEFNMHSPYPFELNTADWLGSLEEMQLFFKYIIDFGSYINDPTNVHNQQFNRILPNKPNNKESITK